ncbi:Ig-like domain-containing protein [Maribacter sp. 2304DJ31-5]|uniref:Ig-like domain-containing protein n=1 Tax=Maribacter sp. 2304DJ31-5 TaxID=3386273 RepID=UPI0039BD2554
MINYWRALMLVISIIFIACSSNNEEIDPLENDNTPPVLDLTFKGFPNISEGSPIVVSKKIEIAISAEDSNGIDKIEAFLDGEKVGEDASAPYLITIDVSQYTSKSIAGKYKNYTLEIVATDRAGNTTSKEQIINVDNEIPVVSDVSLIPESTLTGNTNPFSFLVSDNEGLESIMLYLNEELYAQVEIEEPYESNIDTSVLPDGSNILKIEATDVAGNMAIFELDFITDNSGPVVSFENLTDQIIIDEVLLLNPTVTDEYSEVVSIEIKFNDETLTVTDSEAPINYEFDPENYSVGESTFEIIAIDGLGNTSSMTIDANIYRRLIEINIPENRINPSITAAVVFVSRMDGSNVVWQEIVPEDRQIILSVPESFDLSTEFMVSFFMEDNGGMASITTHQNLTRGNPGVLNLAEPVRREGNGSGRQVPIVNFLSNDVLIGESGPSYSFFQSTDDSPASYTVYLDTAQDFLNISTAEDPVYLDPFDQVYVFDLSTYENTLISYPPASDYTLDKANLRNDNLENGQLVVSSPNILANTNSVMRIAGALSQEDEVSNKFHEMFVWNRVGNLDTPMDYTLNSTFYSYRHALHFGNYYTERKGRPLASYTVPDVSLDYSISDNEINIAVQGTEHVVGRVQCVDFDNLTYVWNITYDSENISTVIIPELPVSISHPIESAHQSGNIKVEKVELISYGSISSYDQYIDRMVKNQTNVLEATDWYQLVFKSRTGDFNIPIRDFLFQ